MVDMLLLIGLVTCSHVWLRAQEMLADNFCAVQGKAKWVARAAVLAAALLVFTAVSLAFRGTSLPAIR